MSAREYIGRMNSARQRERMAIMAQRGRLSPQARHAAVRAYGPMPAAQPRIPLTAGQHILHLLITVVTAGLWLPVWIWLAVKGQPRPQNY